MADNLKQGQKVQLRSGGPIMTIESVGRKMYAEGGPDDHAWCHWFEKNKLQTAVFPFTSLDVVN